MEKAASKNGDHRQRNSGYFIYRSHDITRELLSEASVALITFIIETGEPRPRRFFLVLGLVSIWCYRSVAGAYLITYCCLGSFSLLSLASTLTSRH